MYKCIKEFSLETCDYDGFTIEGEYLTVKKDSIWDIPEDESFRLIGGEVRLESDDYGWIEISEETLIVNFEVIN